MIHVSFNLSNPWSRRFNALFSRTFNTPFEYKFIEVEAYKDSTVISFSFDFTTQQDHAGLAVAIGLLGYCAGFNFYDSRHWNVESNSW